MIAAGLDDLHSRIRMRGSNAGIAQLVEHDLAKVGVASSSLVSRSSFQQSPDLFGALSFQRRAWPTSGAGGMARSTKRQFRYSQRAPFCYHSRLRCGNSSVGRARPCQGRGREFESRFPLQFSAKPRLTGVLFFRSNLRSLRSRCTKQWPGGRVVMQRPAKPRTPVRFRPWPPLRTKTQAPPGAFFFGLA